METIQTQQENVKELLRLATENPNLPIVPMVDSEVVCDCTFFYWMGSFGKSRIDEILSLKWSERTIIKSKFPHYEELYEEIFVDVPDPAPSDEEIKQKVDALPWVRVIIVDINLPDPTITEEVEL